MELLSLAILIVLVGALLAIGWHLAPVILVGIFVYCCFRYRREIPRIARALFQEWRKKK